MPRISSKKKAICKVGDRIQVTGKIGFVTNTSYSSIFPYEIKWENGRFSYHKESDFELYGFKVLPSDPTGEDVAEEGNLWIQSSLEFSDGHSTDSDGHSTILSLIEQGVNDTAQLSAKTGLGMSAIAQQLRKLSEQGKIHRIDYQWKIKNSDSSTCVLGWALDSHSPDSSSEENLPLLAYAKLTTTAEISSPSDIQACQSLETSNDTTGEPLEESTSLQPPLLANLSAFKENDLEPTMSETVSQQSSKRSPKSNRRTSRLKMSKDSLAAPSDLVTKSDTLQESSPSFPSAGTMRSGKWSAADILEAPSLEKDSFWLASPSALSSHVSRKPGQSKLERQLKDLEAISPGKNVNPIFLEAAFEIPLGFSDPSEYRSAAQLLADEGKPLATPLTPESPPSPSNECSTSIALLTKEELTPVDESCVGKHYWYDSYTVAVEVLCVRNWRETPRGPLIKGADTRPWWFKDSKGQTLFSETLTVALADLEKILEFSCPIPQLNDDSLEKSETHTSRQVGSLYQYTANRAGKDGIIREYPIVEGRDRDRGDDKDWYWGISYVEKVNGKWRDRSASIPQKSLQLARAMMRGGIHVGRTIDACQLKFSYLSFREPWVIGEVRPDVCPRLFLLHLGEGFLYVSPPSQWGELNAEVRQELWLKIDSAISLEKTVEEVKQLLCL